MCTAAHGQQRPRWASEGVAEPGQIKESPSTVSESLDTVLQAEVTEESVRP